ncbi:MAG: hypothetical protein ACOX8L_01345 [Candidatus Methanomethylophilaceae archaeon]|jgi:hypothetical protein
METLRFEITPAEGEELSEERKEAIINSVQSLLTDIGMFILTAEMGFQGAVPEGFENKFRLDGEPVRDDYENSLIRVALSTMEKTLDVAGTEIANRWLSETYTDPRYRTAIAKDLMKLCDGLKGSELSYGTGRRMKRLYNARSERFAESAEADTRMFACALAGAVVKGDGKKEYFLDTGSYRSKIVAGKSFTAADADALVSEGALLVSGMARLGEDGNIAEIRDICGTNAFPGIVFKRIVCPEKDLALLNPVSADVSFDRTSRKWTLSNEIMGISVSRPGWNDAVSAFHDYFMFLWETYAADGKENLSGEEEEIRDYLLSLVPF